MKKVLFSLLVLSLIIVSCGGPSPVKFNDALVKANTAIGNVGAAYQNDLSQAISSESFENIAVVTDSALAKIDAELEIVKALEAPKGGETFKAAALKSYESLRTVVETSRKFAVLTKESTQEDFDKIEKEYDEKFDEYSKSFDELAKAQMDYAKEAGYKVQ
ncbi:MAG: hypothetical protein ACK5KT_07725 [Dysgonomonas sp.]